MITGKKSSGSHRAMQIGRGGLRRLFERFDWTLLLVTMVLAGIGILNLFSATLGTPHSQKFEQQIVWMLLGLCVYLSVAFFDYRNFYRFAWVFLALVCLAVFVASLTSPIKGAQRWLALGPIRAQPSEFAKIVVLLATARVLHQRAQGDLSPLNLGLSIVGLLVPVVLILLQPDLGTATLTALVAVTMALFLVRPVWPIVSGLAVAAFLSPFFWDRMHEYQKGRVLAFLDPEADQTGAGWQTQQSIFAVGSGRWTGKGFTNATQNQFKFLPEHWTDFPFAVLAEEWGFMGSVVLLLIFAFLVLWAIHIALGARDRFGAAICVGVAAMLFWHTYVNISMVIGMAPVVGVTLPLISYGGSSVLTIMFGIGLVASVSRRRHSLS